MEQLDAAGIPLRLKNVTNSPGPGTIIYPSTSEGLKTERPISLTPTAAAEDKIYSSNWKNSFMLTNGYYGPGQYRRRPTAITSVCSPRIRCISAIANCSQKDQIDILNIRSHGTTSRQRFLSRVSACLEEHDMTIDLINSSQQTLSVAVPAPHCLSLERSVSDMEKLGAVTVITNLSIVSIIGHKMRNVVAIGAEILSALAGAKINIYLISQRASEINIS